MVDIYEKAFIVDPMSGDLCEGFYTTRDQKAIKVKDGVAYVNGVEAKLAPGYCGIRIDEQKYNRLISARLSGREFSDAMTAEPPTF